MKERKSTQKFNKFRLFLCSNMFFITPIQLSHLVLQCIMESSTNFVNEMGIVVGPRLTTSILNFFVPCAM